MAKVAFSKLQAKINTSTVQEAYQNASGESIYYDIKQYLPFVEKLELVSRIVNLSSDDNGFYNPMRVKFFMTLEIVYAYTNLSFTDKMKEDPFKIYDILISTGLFKNILNHIDCEEIKTIEDGVWETIKNIYDYKNSILGVLETVQADYNNLNLDVDELKSKIENTENLDFLKTVVSKLG